MKLFSQRVRDAELTWIRFPKLTNDLIKSSLGEHFAQIGATKADKKWVFVSVA